MTSYEIYLMAGSLLGVIAFMSLVSVLMDQGSVRMFGFLLVLTLGALYLAREKSENGVDFHDLPPAIGKLIGPYLPER